MFIQNQDAYLPQQLLDNLMYMYNYVEMACVMGVPILFLLVRGQSIKVGHHKAILSSFELLPNWIL